VVKNQLFGLMMEHYVIIVGIILNQQLNQKQSLQRITKMKEESKQDKRDKIYGEIPKEICILTIRDNINRVESGRDLTMPLHRLRTNCKFNDFYNDFCDMKYGKIIDLKQKLKKRKNSIRKQECKYCTKIFYIDTMKKQANKSCCSEECLRLRRVQVRKIYYQRPEVIKREKEYYRKYYLKKKKQKEFA